MERRKLLKSIGLGVLVGSTGIIASCAKAADSESTEVKKSELDTTSTVVEKELTAREKLIVNRKPMTFLDPEKPTDFENKHTPEILVKEKNAKGFSRIDILVGSQGIIHPTEDNHWIDYIQLWQNEALIGKVEYEIGVAGGFASFYILLNPGDKLKAEIGCNLHGIWTSLLEA